MKSISLALKTILVCWSIFYNASYAQFSDCLKARPFADAMSFEKTDCSDAYDLSAELLGDFKEQRMALIKDTLGSALQNSIVQSVDDMAQVDFLHSFIGKDYGTKSTCSISKIMEKNPCLKESNEYLRMITRNKYKNVNQLFTSIATEYQEKVSGYTNLNSQQCLNPFIRKKILLDQLIEENREVDLYDLSEKVKKDNATTNETKFFNKLVELLGFEDDLEFGQLEGSNFEEQLKSLVENNSQKLESNAIKVCESMVSRISGVLCQPINQHRIDDSGFNGLVFNYDGSAFDLGFDEFEAEFSDIGTEKSYGHFVLNCEPKCEGECENSHNVDSILSDHFPESIEEYIMLKDKEDSLDSNVLDNELCPLIACENALKVQEGAACEQREKPRSLVELKSYLDCSNDQYCQSPQVKSFLAILGDQEKRIEKEVPLMSSFSQNFLGEEYFAPEGPEVATRKIEVEQSPAPKLSTVAPSPKIAQRGSQSLEKRKSGRMIGKTSPGSLNSSDSPQNKASTNSFVPVNTTESKAPKKYNRADRDLFSAMGNLIRGALDNQEKSQDIYNQNLEDLVAANRDLERKIEAKTSNLSGQSNFPSNRPSPSKKDPRVNGPSRVRERGSNRLWENELARNRELNDRWRSLEEDTSDRASEKFETNPGRPKPEGTIAVTEGTEVSPDSQSTNSSSESVSDSSNEGKTEERAEGLAGVGAAAFNGDNLKAIETNVTGITRMDQEVLLKEGLSLDEPFLLKVQWEDKLVTVPVKPFLYKGEKMLAPVLDQDNYILGDVLRKSPLFVGYFDYERERQKQLSLL